MDGQHAWHLGIAVRRSSPAHALRGDLVRILPPPRSVNSSSHGIRSKTVIYPEGHASPAPQGGAGGESEKAPWRFRAPNRGEEMVKALQTLTFDDYASYVDLRSTRGVSEKTLARYWPYFEPFQAFVRQHPGRVLEELVARYNRSLKQFYSSNARIVVSSALNWALRRISG